MNNKIAINLYDRNLIKKATFYDYSNLQIDYNWYVTEVSTFELHVEPSKYIGKINIGDVFVFATSKDSPSSPWLWDVPFVVKFIECTRDDMVIKGKHLLCIFEDDYLDYNERNPHYIKIGDNLGTCLKNIISDFCNSSYEDNFFRSSNTSIDYDSFNISDNTVNRQNVGQCLFLIQSLISASKAYLDKYSIKIQVDYDNKKYVISLQQNRNMSKAITIRDINIDDYSYSLDYNNVKNGIVAEVFYRWETDKERVMPVFRLVGAYATQRKIPSQIIYVQISNVTLDDTDRQDVGWINLTSAEQQEIQKKASALMDEKWKEYNPIESITIDVSDSFNTSNILIGDDITIDISEIGKVYVMGISEIKTSLDENGISNEINFGEPKMTLSKKMGRVIANKATENSLR